MPQSAHRRLGISLTWAMLAVGVATSLALGAVWRSEAGDRASKDFSSRASLVSAAVVDGITRMDDLTIGARAKIASDRKLTNAELAAWYRSVDGRRRYPGSLGFGYAAVVPRSGLARYLASVHRDPVPGLRPPAKLAIFPSGPRSSYCLIRLGVGEHVDSLVPGYGYDLCSIPGLTILAHARDSGRLATLSAQLDGSHILVVAAPVYSGGGIPAGVAARRRLIRGWTAGVFDATTVLKAATAGDPGIGIRLRSAGGTTLSYGRSVSGAHTLRERFVVGMDGRWTIDVAQAQRAALLTPGLQGVAVAGAGILVTLLAFAVVQLLVRGRARALRMVDEKTDELRFQALHDALTGLPNRVLIADRAQQMLVRSRRRGTPVSALFIDLDEFKNVNDTFGHPAGDELLRSVAARLAGSLREGDTVGRLGGDEFVVLVEGDAQSPGPEAVAERLLEALRAPHRLGSATDVTLTTSASIGIATGDRATASDLLRDADIALYEAKAAGKDRYAVFRQEMHTAVHDRLELEIDLRSALERGELFVVYQPTFDLTRGTVTGVEALVRWHHPSRGVLRPREFVPLAEESGLIVPIGSWVLETACRAAARWHAAGHEIDVSVNVSARQLNDPGLVETVRRVLESSGLRPTSLILEITETALVRNAELAIAKLARLKALGPRIAIDDFGTGYSSLAYLQQFPVDALKIDQSFVAGITESSESKALIHTFVELGNALGLTTIAEGIEQPAQLDHLRTERCDKGQGFLFARPLSASELRSVLDEQRRAKPPAPGPGREREHRLLRPRSRPLEA